MNKKILVYGSLIAAIFIVSGLIFFLEFKDKAKIEEETKTEIQETSKKEEVKEIEMTYDGKILNKEKFHIAITLKDQDLKNVPDIRCSLINVKANVRKALPLHDFNPMFEKKSDAGGKCFFYDLDPNQIYMIKFTSGNGFNHYPYVTRDTKKGSLVEKDWLIFQNDDKYQHGMGLNIKDWKTYTRPGRNFSIQYPDGFKFIDTPTQIVGDELVYIYYVQAADDKINKSLTIEVSEETKYNDINDDLAINVSGETGMNIVKNFIEGSSEVTKLVSKVKGIGGEKYMVYQNGRIFEISGDCSGFDDNVIEKMIGSISTDLAKKSPVITTVDISTSGPAEIPTTMTVDGESWNTFYDKRLGFLVPYPADFKLKNPASTSGLHLVTSDVEYSEYSFSVIKGAEVQILSSAFVGATAEYSLGEWYAKKNSSVRSDMGKWPTDDFKVQVSGDGKNVFSEMNWNCSRTDPCYRKSAFFYDEKEYIELELGLEVAGSEIEKYKKIFNKMIANSKFID